MTRPTSKRRSSVRRNSGDIPPNVGKAEEFAQMLTELMAEANVGHDCPYYYAVVTKRKYILVDKVQDLSGSPSHMGDFVIGPGGPGEENGIVYRSKQYGVPNLRSRIGSLDKCLSSDWHLEHGLFPAMVLRRTSRKRTSKILSASIMPTKNARRVAAKLEDLLGNEDGDWFNPVVLANLMNWVDDTDAEAQALTLIEQGCHFGTFSED